MRPGAVCLNCVQSTFWTEEVVMKLDSLCIEKSLFALSPFRICPLSQVKYLLSVSVYKSALQSPKGQGSKAPGLVEQGQDVSEGKHGESGAAWRASGRRWPWARE